MSEAWREQPRSHSGQFGRKPTNQADTPDPHQVDLNAPDGPSEQYTGIRELLEAISAAPDRGAMVEAGIQDVRSGADRRNVALMVLAQSAGHAEADGNDEERQAADDLAEVLLLGAITEDLADIWMPEQFERDWWRTLEHPTRVRWIEKDVLDCLKRDIKTFPDEYTGEPNKSRASAALTDLKLVEAMRFKPRPLTAAAFSESGFTETLRGHQGRARDIGKHLDAAVACADLFAVELCLHQDIERIAPARSAPSSGMYPEERRCGYCEGCYECSGSQPLAREAARLMENTMLRTRHHCLAAQPGRLLKASGTGPDRLAACPERKSTNTVSTQGATSSSCENGNRRIRPSLHGPLPGSERFWSWPPALVPARAAREGSYRAVHGCRRLHTAP